MTTVQTILQTKGALVVSVTPETRVSTALELMADKNIGALVVTNDGTLAGIFSERDFARTTAAKGMGVYDRPVKDLMTSIVFTVSPNQSIDECMAVMTDRHIRHLPVLEHQRLTGVVSIGDVVKAVISEKEHVIQQLENYITGAR
ncbi:MAG TPA: CBS domain-containing protein [Bacteroidota bacterium]|nr:CBS domain-containing protein [Bacteroidota bacterium]